MNGRILHPSSVSLLAGVRPARAFFFCDESGRSGGNYLDASQLHVLAGYLVGESWWPKLKAAVERVKGRRIGAEVKAAKLLRTRVGRRKLNHFILEMDWFLPVLVVLHKRHYAGMRLVNLLLNPKFNPSARDLRLGDGGANELDTAFSVAMSDQTLRRYIDVTHAPNPEGLRYILEAAASDLGRAGWHDLRRRVLGIRGNLPAVAKALQDELKAWDVIGPKGNVFRVGTTVDFDAFYFCIDALDRMLDQLKQTHPGIQQVDVICDTPQGMEAFRRLHAELKASGRLKNLRNLNPGDSGLNLGLQAADLLAGSVRYVFGNSQVAREFREAADALVFSFFSSPSKGHLLISQEQYRRLASQSTDFWRRRQRVRENIIVLLRSRMPKPTS